MGTVPVRLKADDQRYALKAQHMIKQGEKQKDAQSLDNYPVPKLVTAGNFELVGRHPNKAAFIVFGDNADYSTKAELNLLVGAFGAVQTAVDPDTGMPAQYQYPNIADGASLVLSEATDDTGIVSLVGKPNFRAAIKAKADTVKIHAREILELAAGGENYIGNTALNPSAYGAVHIVAGNRIKEDQGSDFSLQAIPKGENLVEFLNKQCEFILNIVSVQQKIIEDIVDLKKTLITFATRMAGLPPGAVGSPPIAAAAAGEIAARASACGALTTVLGASAPDNAKALSNNLGIGTNFPNLQCNHLYEIAPKYILSRFNKVN
jgi:hypothetical protein